MHIKKLIDSGQLVEKQRRGSVIPMPSLPRSVNRRPEQRVMPVKWNPPDPTWIKLNTASRHSEVSGQARGGGTIRDHLGQLLLAFSVSLSAASTLEASAQTMSIGLSEAKDLGPQIWAETDDPQVVRLALAKSYGPAHSRQQMARLLMMTRERTTRFAHICSAKNKAALSLTKLDGETTTM